MQFTGERFIPTEKGAIRLEHYHRYAMILDLVKDKRVLDVACGEGYGSSLMSDLALSVVGVDISDQTIQHASETYKNSNLTFRQGSAVALDHPDESFDIVVSFETIEHLAEQKEMIAEIRRVLDSNGVLVISSPNRPVYSGERGERKNEFHVKELDFSELDDLLKASFKSIRYYGQRLLANSVIQALKGEESFYQVWREDRSNLKKGSNPLPEPVYFVAVAGNNESSLPEIPSSMMYPVDWDLLDNYKELVGNQDSIIINLNRTLAENTSAINDLNELIIERDAVIKNFDQMVIERDAVIKNFDQMIIKRDAAVKSLTRKLDDAGKELSSINEVKLRSEEEIIKLNQNLSERDVLISDLNQKLAENAKHLAELNQKANDQNSQLTELKLEMNTFLNSKSWRITRPLRSIKKLIEQK